MGFWIFMTIFNLLLPFTMLGFGSYFMKSSPKNINTIFGYRTSMSMKNKDTWVFAHQYCGKLWRSSGLILSIVSLVAMLFVIGKSVSEVGNLGVIVCYIQMAVMIGSIFPTERALRRNFDKDGNKR